MRGGVDEIAGVSFDLFGTLVEIVAPHDPVTSIASELERRGIDVPDDWEDALSELHVDAAPTQEIPLPEHVTATLDSRGFDTNGSETRHRIEEAVLAAFDVDIRRRPGALEAVDAAKMHGPVGILSNCSVPGLARRTLEQTGIDNASLNATVTSIQLGWRKPDRRAFLGVARELGIEIEELLHVGDDHRTDGAAEEFGAKAFMIDERSLPEIAAVLRERC